MKSSEDSAAVLNATRMTWVKDISTVVAGQERRTNLFHGKYNLSCGIETVNSIRTRKLGARRE